MISNTKLKIRTRRKTSPVLVETIEAARKNENWKEVAKVLSGPTRAHASVNLDIIDEKTKAGDTIVIPGKVLSKGELTKKIKICTLSVSDSAREKIKDSKSEIISILEEIKKNPKAEGVRIL